MNQRPILLICALLAAASSLATCQNRIDFKYVDFAPMMEGNSFHERVHEAFQALMSIGNLPPADLETKLQLYKTNCWNLRRAKKLNSDQWFVFRCLTVLGNESVKESDFNIFVETLMDICYVYSHYAFDNLNGFDDYLSTKAQPIFTSSMVSSIGKLVLPGTQANNDALLRLDEIFDVFSTADRPMTYIQRLKALKDFDMRNFSYDRAVAFGTRVTNTEGSYLGLFFLYLQNQCKILRSGREFHFNVLGLARAFGVNQNNMPHQVQILMEYNRLCASAANVETREFIRMRGEPYEFIPTTPGIN